MYKIVLNLALGTKAVDNETTDYVTEHRFRKGLKERSGGDKPMQHHKVFIISRVVEKSIFNSFPSWICIKFCALLESNIMTTTPL